MPGVELDTIFKAYDIRGRTDNGELTEPVARAVGAAFAAFVGGPEIAVGRDCRDSSTGLTEAFIDGVLAQGVDVTDLGEVATDMVYYVSGAREVPGAMITASHNPSNYNGIKLCGPAAKPIGVESGLADIKAAAAGGVSDAASRGERRVLDSAAGYIEHLLSIVDPSAIGPLRVAVDGGNGMVGVVLPALFEALPATLIGLYLEPDGTFPNHPANPLEPENLVDLIALVHERSPSLGVAFDGDADRAFFIDDRGEPLSGSTTTALIARWFLDRRPGATIVHNLITSRAVPDVVQAAGGTPVRTRVGHSYIKQVMAETGAVFGGEHSGHYYFADNYRADSGMLAMLVLLQVLTEAGVPLSELRKSVEPYAQSGEVNFTVHDQAAAIARVAAAFDGEHDRLDGLTVCWPDRWFNVRASNTEPLLRVNVEAATPQQVAALLADVRAVVEV